MEHLPGAEEGDLGTEWPLEMEEKEKRRWLIVMPANYNTSAMDKCDNDALTADGGREGQRAGN